MRKIDNHVGVILSPRPPRSSSVPDDGVPAGGTHEMTGADQGQLKVKFLASDVFRLLCFLRNLRVYDTVISKFPSPTSFELLYRSNYLRPQ